MSTNDRKHKPGELDAPRLTAYALGQLAAEERAAVEAEVASSEDAAEYVKATRELGRHVSEATHHLAAIRPSAELRVAVDSRLTELEAEADAAHGAWPLRVFRTSRTARRLLALAACLMLAAIPLDLLLIGRQGAGEVGVRLDPGRTQEAALAASAANDAAADAGTTDAANESEAAMAGLAGDAADPPSAGIATDMAGPPDEIASQPLEQGGAEGPALSPDGPVAAGVAAGKTAIASRGAAGIRPGRGPTTGLPRDARSADSRVAMQQNGGSEELLPGVDALHNLESRRPKAKRSSAPGGKGLAIRGPTRLPAGPTWLPAPRRKPSPTTPGALASIPSERPEVREKPATAAPPAAEHTSSFVENDFRAVSSHAVSSIPIATETTSYAEVRDWLNAGQLPPPEAVRIEELINHFPFSVPAAEAGKPFSVSMEVAECPWNNGHRLVRIALKEAAANRGSVQVVEVEFNPALVDAYRLIGHDRFLADRDPGPDAKEASSGREVTALYELIPVVVAAGNAPLRPLKYQNAKAGLLKAADSGELLALKIHHLEPGRRESVVAEYALKDAAKPFAKGSSDFRFAAAVAAFGMVLRESPFRGTATLESVEEITASAIKDRPGDPRAEFLELVRLARRTEASVDATE